MDYDYYQSGTDKSKTDDDTDQQEAQGEPLGPPDEQKPDEPKAETPVDNETQPAADQDPKKVYNAYIERLIVQLGFDKVEEPQKSKLIDAIKQRVEARVLRTLMTSLTEEQSKELDKEVAEKGLEEEQIIELLADKAPNAATTILSALDDLYQEMKEETDALWQASAAKAANQEEAPQPQA